ncbi:MAG: ABC transporter permease [Rhodospirillaceae bacterium]|nr:ABC transporter permease [Rhodospirillaceae bacterium]MBT8004097.1 ABC transporter permease [Rhodospirillales bacterium]MBT4699747.1 ABC transporter permease [Rhodospirillaceae bacterium]MBT5035559.1 ABC transporter permease [Rhodospirillaceae bacterium]MBT6219094.1 ABC transporter permease [Rhodospirillaceae bacterium]
MNFSWLSPALRGLVVRFSENRMAAAGLIFVTIVAIVAALAPIIAPYDPDEINLKERLVELSWAHPFGTDSFGRDLLSRVIYGARISVIAGLGSVSAALVMGVFVGAVAGYAGRVWDNSIMRVMDAIMAFPGILLAIALVSVLGASLTNVCIALAIRYTPHFARIVRGSVLAEREKEYVEAARVQGESNFRILFRQILPNCMAPILVQCTLDFAQAIISESSLSFLGLGVPPPTPSWGNILHAAKGAMEFYPWGAIFPGLAICFTVLGLNMLGDGLRDVLDPRLSEEHASNE